jgi:maltooligosyltrehalose trehalohydrolase
MGLERHKLIKNGARKQARPGHAGPTAAHGSARKFPIGAEAWPNGVHFRVWAPKLKQVRVRISNDPKLEQEVETVSLNAEGNGYHSALSPEARTGMYYKFSLRAGCFPDPASRFQPEGPHGASQIIDSTRFSWRDHKWPGVERAGQIIYEMHIGTFTPEGTWTAALKQLPELQQLGITTLEIMPIADFPGRFGWGYDGVNLFAPTRLYGSPDDFRRFVNAAHQHGLAVILDVVYNHLGPDGNYLKKFSDDYFTQKYKNEWGEPLNFDGKNSGPVREFFCSNAEYWISEFHLDGLRLDATQQIFDESKENIMTLICRKARAAAKGRNIYIVGENESQESCLARPVEQGGMGLDALWNDDFHHSVITAITGRNEAYYSDYRGSPQEMVSLAKYGYLYQGQYFKWQQQPRGYPALDLAPAQFVNYLQNHDQVANSLRGYRLQHLTSPGRLRAATALMMVLPGTLMLLQGQEFAASAPFLYFANHNPDLAKLVTVGRKKFLKQFKTIACPEVDSFIDNPEALETFERCKLDFSEREKHAGYYQLHRDLIALRRKDPVFSKAHEIKVDGAVIGPEAFLLRYFGPDQNDRLLLVNFGLDLCLNSIPEPLIAPPNRCGWEMLWSSEDPRYGGCGSLPLDPNEAISVTGHSAMILRPNRKKIS